MNSKKRNLLIIIGILLIAGGAVWARRHNSSQAEKTPDNNPHKVKVVSVSSQYKGFIPLEGIIKGKNEIYLAPKAQGRIVKIYKEMGERVWRGQLLALIDGRETWAQTQIAQAGYDLAKRSSKKTRKYFDEQVSQAKKAKELAKESYENAKASGDSEKIAQAKYNYEMARKQLEVAEKGRDLQKTIAKGKKEVANQQLMASQIVADNNRVRAPFSGVIAQVKVEKGDLVSPERPLFLLVDDSAWEIKISVPTEIISQIKVGQKLKIIGSDGQETFGLIKAISPMVDTYSRKSLIEISLKPSDSFRLGEYVKVLVPTASQENLLIIPRQALLQEYLDNFIFTVENDLAKKIPVEVVQDFGKQIGVKIKNEKNNTNISNVIVNGQWEINNREKIEIIKDK